MVHLALVVGAFLLYTSSYAQQASGCCPDEWTKVGTACYRYYGQLKTWDAAEDYCQEVGGHLVSIVDKAENNAVFQLWKSYQAEVARPGFWIGRRRESIDGNWKWSDGTPTRLNNNYAPNEPSTRDNRYCMEIWAGGSTDQDQQLWAARLCKMEKDFMCKVPLPA